MYRGLKIKTLLPVIRLLIVLVTLTLIVYFTAYLGLLFPYINSLRFAWSPDNVFTIAEVSDTDSNELLQVDDVIAAIDGKSTKQSVWQPLFPPHQATY